MAILPKKSMKWSETENLRPQPQIFVEYASSLPWVKKSLERILQDGLGPEYDVQVLKLVRDDHRESYDRLVVVYRHGTTQPVLTFLQA